MALVQWKQLDSLLTGSSVYTGSFEVTGSIVLNGIDLGLINAGIFKQTGSFYATTNDLEVTGSMKLSLDGVSDYFSVSVGGVEQLKVNEEGILVLSAQDITPSAVTGGIFYSSSDAYFLGFTN